jgi:hypothetical protein
MANLRDLRWRLSRPIRDLATGSATSGGSTTLVDTARTEAQDYWTGAELWIYDGAASANLRTVTAYTASTTTMTFSPSVASPVANTSRYELHSRLTKADYDDAINGAIRRARDRMIRITQDTSLTGGSNTEYTLPSAVGAGRLGEVWYQSGASPTKYRQVDFLDWDETDNGSGSPTLRLYDANCVQSGSAILLKYEAPQAELSADADTVMSQAEEYILAFARYRIHSQLWMRQDVDVEEHGRQAMLAKQEAEDLLHDMQPERLPGKMVAGDQHRHTYTVRRKGPE